MSAETDIAAIDDGGANTAAEVRTVLTSILVRADSPGLPTLFTPVGQKLASSAVSTPSSGTSDHDGLSNVSADDHHVEPPHLFSQVIGVRQGLASAALSTPSSGTTNHDVLTNVSADDHHIEPPHQFCLMGA